MRGRQPVICSRIHPQIPANATQVEIDGEMVIAYLGESVAAVLMASGRRMFTPATRHNPARTIFCGMGICFQCLVTIDGVRDVRACMTLVAPGMKIQTCLAQRGVDHETG